MRLIKSRLISHGAMQILHCVCPFVWSSVESVCFLRLPCTNTQQRPPRPSRAPTSRSCNLEMRLDHCIPWLEKTFGHGKNDYCTCPAASVIIGPFRLLSQHMHCSMYDLLSGLLVSDVREDWSQRSLIRFLFQETKEPIPLAPATVRSTYVCTKYGVLTGLQTPSTNAMPRSLPTWYTWRDPISTRHPQSSLDNLHRRLDLRQLAHTCALARVHLKLYWGYKSPRMEAS